MNIDINQHKIAIGAKYDVYVDSQPAYKAASELLKILSVIDLYELPAGQLKIQIKKKWAWFKARYELIRDDGTICYFRTSAFWKIEYRCDAGNDVYDIYGHRGRKHSIFKNGQQIAWWDKEAVTWFDGDNYSMTANNNADVPLLVSFCLVIDNYSSKNHDKDVTVSYGNLGLRSRKFDSNWMPS